MEWAQHGSYSLDWQGDVLIARYAGEWNEVAATNLHRDARDLWQARVGRPWGLLSDASEWGGATPQALDAWWGFFEDAVAHGLSAATDILPSRLHEMMVNSMLERARPMIRFHRSQSVEEAWAWLASEGFSIA